MRQIIEKTSIQLTDKQIKQFEKYYEMLIETNKVMNLTAITDRNEVIEKHFIDSLLCIKAINLDGFKSLIDVGTGAGFPGIPLKIAFPHLEVTLMDSLNKRVGFLHDVIEELELENIEAIHDRAEDMARNPEYREQFDLCVSRAVANLAVLSEYCLPFIKVGGAFLSYKSSKVESEIVEAANAIDILGGKIESYEKFCLPGTDMERTILVIRKEKNTPEKYPRKPGAVQKKPIK